MSRITILVGQLVLRACAWINGKSTQSICDCGERRGCRLASYCNAARAERSAAARLEKCFWVVTTGSTMSLMLYLVFISR